jgi:hypothetical protein
MASLVVFRKINKRWRPSLSTYEVVFGGLVGFYLNRTLAPNIYNDLYQQIGEYLYECWPRKFQKMEGQAIDYFNFTEFPRPQQVELLRASEAMLKDVEEERTDSHLIWDRSKKANLVQILSEFIALMREELAAR